METSIKDAARSKYKHSRKHQPRASGRGRGWTSRARQSGPADLGSNWDRYEDEEDENQLAQGPVRRSQGADLAEWAAQHPPQDPLFFARQRVNLNQDVGLPPAEPDAFQGLSFDLQGLAACLQALPLGEVLKLPPGLAGEDRDGGGVDSGETIRVKEVQRVAVNEKKEEARPAVVAAPPPPPLAAAPPPKPAPAAPPQPAAAPAHVEDLDAELEALLGLGAPAAPAPAAAGARQSNTTAGDGDSLEAWLDTL